jgi:hypothetical protein
VGAGYGCYLSSHDEVARLPTLVDQFERQAFRPEILQSLISADDARLVVWVAGVKAPEVLRHVDGLEINRINQLVVEPTLQTTTRFGSAPAFVCTCSPDDRTDRSAMAVSPEKGEGSSPGHIRTGSRVRSSGPVAGGMLYQDSAVELR